MCSVRGHTSTVWAVSFNTLGNRLVSCRSSFVEYEFTFRVDILLIVETLFPVFWCINQHVVCVVCFCSDDCSLIIWDTSNEQSAQGELSWYGIFCSIQLKCHQICVRLLLCTFVPFPLSLEIQFLILAFKRLECLFYLIIAGFCLLFNFPSMSDCASLIW